MVHHEGRIDNDDVVEVDGRLTLMPRLCVWQVATSTTQRGALVVMDSALNTHAIDDEQLASAAVEYASWPGARSAALVARLADGDAESAGESLARFLCYEQHLPKPRLQYVVHDEHGVAVARTDLAWLDYAHVGEFDGMVKYTRGRRDGESTSDVVVREKRREDLVRRQRLGMSRLIWANVLAPRARGTGVWVWRDLQQSASLYRRNRTVIAV